MLTSFDLSRTVAVVMDQEVHMRRIIRQTMNQLGVTTVHECKAFDDVRKALRSSDIDLVMLDLDARPQEVHGFVRDIRHQKIGTNPFVVIIAATWSPREDIVRMALNAGTDDIITKPISVQLLNDRVVNLVRNRKEFVATSTYLGPDRRSSRRDAGDEDGIFTISVPNSLRHKATGDESAAVDTTKVTQATRAMSLQKLHYLTHQIARLAAEFETASSGGEDDMQEPIEIASLEGLVEQVDRYVTEIKFNKLSKLVASMRDTMTVISEAPSPTARQFQLLKLNSQAITAALKASAGSTEAVVSALDEAIHTGDSAAQNP